MQRRCGNHHPRGQVHMRTWKGLQIASPTRFLIPGSNLA